MLGKQWSPNTKQLGFYYINNASGVSVTSSLSAARPWEETGWNNPWRFLASRHRRDGWVSLESKSAESLRCGNLQNSEEVSFMAQGAETLLTDPLKDPKPLQVQGVTCAEEPTESPSTPAPCDLNTASAISKETTLASTEAWGRVVCRTAEQSHVAPQQPLWCAKHTQRSWGRRKCARKHLWIPCRTPPMATFHPFLFHKRFHLLHLWPQGTDK